MKPFRPSRTCGGQRRRPNVPSRRRGVFLVLFVMLLVVFLGMLGLVIDGGLLMASYRQTHNAADAAALSAAIAKFRRQTDDAALAEANAFVAANSPFSPALALNNGANDTLNIPPAAGPYVGIPNFAEAIVSTPVRTIFLSLLGANSSQVIRCRAVAGSEAQAAGEGAIVLDPDARPGLSVQGTNAKLKVDGAVIVNSRAEGLDENGNWADTHPTDKKYGIATQPSPAIEARNVLVIGGVDVPGNIQYYEDPTAPNPLTAAIGMSTNELFPDPLINLPTPTTANGVVNTNLGSPQLNNGGANGVIAPNSYDAGTQTLTLNPGIYSSISISGGKAVFNPGIYVLTGGATDILTITGNGTDATGHGVMFYNTGNNFNPATGLPDVNDGETPPPASESPAPTFGGMKVNAHFVDFSGIQDTTSPFHNVLFYFRRQNNVGADIQGNAGEDFQLTGTIYAKWSNFKLAGQGKYQAQFVVGSMAISGNATVTILDTGNGFGLATRVFLVE